MSDAEGGTADPLIQIPILNRGFSRSAQMCAGCGLLALAATHAKRHINILVSSERLFLACTLLLKVSLRFSFCIDWDLESFLREIVSTGVHHPDHVTWGLTSVEYRIVWICFSSPPSSSSSAGSFSIACCIRSSMSRNLLK